MVVVGGDDDEEYSTVSIGLLRKGRLPAHKPSVFFFFQGMSAGPLSSFEVASIWSDVVPNWYPWSVFFALIQASNIFESPFLCGAEIW